MCNEEVECLTSKAKGSIKQIVNSHNFLVRTTLYWQQWQLQSLGRRGNYKQKILQCYYLKNRYITPVKHIFNLKRNCYITNNCG